MATHSRRGLGRGLDAIFTAGSRSGGTTSSKDEKTKKTSGGPSPLERFRAPLVTAGLGMVAEHRHLTHLAYIHRPTADDGPDITWHTAGAEPTPAQQGLLERLEPRSPMPQSLTCDGVDFHLAAIDGATAGVFCFGHADRELTPEEIADTAGLATTYFTVLDQFEAGPFSGPLPVVTAEAHDGGAHITVTRPGSDHVGHAWSTDPARAAVEATLQAFNAEVRRFDVESIHLADGTAVLALLTFDDKRIAPGITLAPGRVAEVAVAATLRALYQAGLIDCG